MIATYGLFAFIGFLAFPLCFLFGLFVVATVSDIFSAVWRSGIQQLDLRECLVLAGVGLFLWDLFMLVQFWRFACRRPTFFSPTALWSLSMCSMIAWMGWFLLGAHSVHWLGLPDYWLYAICFLMWPFTGLVLSGCALCARIRNG
jgi:hypothetical protein